MSKWPSVQRNMCASNESIGLALPIFAMAYTLDSTSCLCAEAPHHMGVSKRRPIDCLP